MEKCIPEETERDDVKKDAALPKCVDQYFRQIAKIPLLKKEEERKLVWKMRRGDTAARAKIIESNLRLVPFIIKRFFSSWAAVFPMADMISAGNVGLLLAADRFKLSKKCRFSTYATYWVWQNIQREVANTKTTVRVPIHRVVDLAKYRKARATLRAKGEEVTRTSVAHEMGLDEKKVERIERANISFVLPNFPHSLLEDDEDALERFIAAPIEDAPHQQVMRNKSRKQLFEALMTSGTLTDEERIIICMRFGINQEGSRSYTLERLGRELGVTRERVRQIQEGALEKLRKAHMPMFKDMRDAGTIPF